MHAAEYAAEHAAETASPVVIRRRTDGDSYERMTEILHAAYARLAAMNLRYKAVDQPASVTQERAESGECFVAEIDGRLVGTVTLYPAGLPAVACDWYRRGDVAILSQFAVDPSLQARGIGRRMIAALEDRARAVGASEIALDTAEPATHLVDWYTRLGFRFIEYVQWGHTNYRTVILSKSL
ncbi:MAG: GNAT family N-acetyltransferase [Alphaproteobacteria bacterium]|nr:GNAT family N-acetyltransferase [Alphaproteobacteria bacterium]